LFSSPTATSACNLQIQSVSIDAEGWCVCIPVKLSCPCRHASPLCW
jgi:hypothetical protein